MQQWEHFVMGAIAMASWVAGLFFLRFWRDTHDRLFAIFAAAFFLLGATRLALASAMTTIETHTYLYWVRLVAFALILLAIIDKNRPRKSQADSSRSLPSTSAPHEPV
jgi:hypothetical protein